MKRLQSTLIVVATTAALTSTITTAQADKKNFRNGVYAGAEMGWLWEEHKYREVVTLLSGPDSPTNVKRSAKKHSNSFLPGIFLGYRHFLEGSLRCYFVGFELNAQINTSHTDAQFRQIVNPGSAEAVVLAKHHLRGRYNIMPSLTFGREFYDKYAVYGKVGYDFGQYRYRLIEKVQGVSGIANSVKSHKDFNRWLLGIGGEFALNCLWSARMEVTYSFPTDGKKVSLSTTNDRGINDYKTHLKVASCATKFGIFAKF